jgi:hypothetical protein
MPDAVRTEMTRFCGDPLVTKVEVGYELEYLWLYMCGVNIWSIRGVNGWKRLGLVTSLVTPGLRQEASPHAYTVGRQEGWDG